MKNYDNISAEVIDLEELETTMMEQTFFNNDDTIVRKMGQKLSKDVLRLPYEVRVELKSAAEEITDAYNFTKNLDIIRGLEYLTPQQYIFAMMNQGWSGWSLLGVSSYLSNELKEAVLKYFVAPKNILK